MAIKRTELPFEGHFVQLPNAWMRDKRLSRRARGLLAELMTHKVGWNINQSSLQEAGPEGREALSSAVKELRECGYLTIQQARSDATQKFGEVEYHITDPHLEPVHGFPVERQNRTTAKPHDGKPAPKNTISKEHHPSEDVEAPKVRSRKAFTTALAATWTPSHANITFATANSLNLQHELGQFRAHAEANDRRQTNWDAAFRLWLGNVVKWRKPEQKGGGSDWALRM
ncbi:MULTISPECIES: helix-turn-helix domain-containing protein [unclassified Cryobacterium]|uniref:helix-turn-helix domain-containing protein n=1 Tax=unclassified Cryobacterium TaxID=2649013 RepID=UPI00106A3D57|nr:MULTISPECIES: helix-turn-helix domain-containing protein [unclassified Cryobacterium]TFC59443.1 helix-turn-helix domain-containing protein [Cryobacterium sp. TMB3-1-2]TFC67239.1 helix-turn-helix domain-containing protein [Cryobacterium sp. TMB3-15]TFC73248.1 helix-turn-helix domain-containing protein [Cryobacterium sp. TMB3-10]TFD46136.1 helix-turn-helix domain-containing protein [Cryobacterium sp. TMB3-12]